MAQRHHGTQSHRLNNHDSECARDDYGRCVRRKVLMFTVYLTTT